MDIERVENVLAKESWLDTECIVCHKEFTLFFNGGELDLHECCDHIYRLETPRIDFVISNNEPSI